MENIDPNIENIEQTTTRKISSDSFNEKISKLKENHKKILSDLKLEEEEKLSKAKDKNNKRIIRRKYRLLKKDARIRFSLTYTAYKNEQLYRKGAFESRVAILKSDYNKRKNSNPSFNKVEEKKKLEEKISELQKKYSKPISRTYRKTRTNKVEYDNFVTVPLRTPLIRVVNSVLLVILAAIITTLALNVFIKPFGIYSAGLRGITQAMFYLWRHYDADVSTTMSYVLFFAANLPLAIFGYFFIGKKFTIYTLLMMLFQMLFSYIFNSETFGNLEAYIKPFGKSSEEIYKVVKEGTNTLYVYVLPYISGIVGAVIYGLAVGVVYRAGGSTGGSKFVVTWVAAKTNSSIGRIALYFSVFVILFGITLNKVIIEQHNFFSGITSTTMIATVMFAVASNIFLDRVYARNKKVLISVITTKRDELVRFLDVKLMYNRTFSVENIKTNFHKKQKHKMEFLVSKPESIKLINIFTQIDPGALISVVEVQNAKGPIYSSWFE